VFGHDLDVEAIASALKNVADDVDGTSVRCSDIAVGLEDNKTMRYSRL
jgi:hypothetical protein